MEVVEFGVELANEGAADRRGLDQGVDEGLGRASTAEFQAQLRVEARLAARRPELGAAAAEKPSDHVPPLLRRSNTSQTPSGWFEESMNNSTLWLEGWETVFFLFPLD